MKRTFYSLLLSGCCIVLIAGAESWGQGARVGVGGPGVNAQVGGNAYGGGIGVQGPGVGVQGGYYGGPYGYGNSGYYNSGYGNQGWNNRGGWGPGYGRGGYGYGGRRGGRGYGGDFDDDCDD